MTARNAGDIEPLYTDHGEVVYELLGAAAGGSQAHSCLLYTSDAADE